MGRTASELAAAARASGEQAALRANEIEALRHMPRDLVEELRAIGVFRMFVPKSHGGLELALPQSLGVFEELAIADGALGWVAMIGSHLPFVASPLPKKGFDALYEAGPDLIGGGSVTPAGTARSVDGGYCVSGRWPFASGCQHADYMFAFCIETGERAPAAGAAGAAPPRVVIVPAKQWEIEDTWHAAGLKGSGSHHIKLNDCFVPAQMSFNLLEATSSIPGPLYAGGPTALLLFHLGAVAVGIAEGAIRDLIAASGRRQLFSQGAMRDSDVFQHELGLADADLEAARALLYRRANQAWEVFSSGGTDIADRFHYGQALAWITQTCAKVADKCFTLGGGSALYESSPLQRRLRDAHAVTQHVIAHYKSFGAAGRARLGFPPVHPLTGQPSASPRA